MPKTNPTCASLVTNIREPAGPYGGAKAPYCKCTTPGMCEQLGCRNDNTAERVNTLEFMNVAR